MLKFHPIDNDLSPDANPLIIHLQLYANHMISVFVPEIKEALSMALRILKTENIIMAIVLSNGNKMSMVLI